MGQAGNAEMMVGARDVELLKEDLRHVGVEVLAGVDDDLADGRVLPRRVALTNGAADRGGFDELGTGADDGEDLHALGVLATEEHGRARKGGLVAQRRKAIQGFSGSAAYRMGERLGNDIAFLPDIRTDPWCRGGFKTRPYVRLSGPMAITG